jgi:hypothetical protein
LKLVTEVKALETMANGNLHSIRGQSFASITSTEPSQLLENFDVIQFDDYLLNFNNEITFSTDEAIATTATSDLNIVTPSARRVRKREFHYRSALTNITNRMIRYGLKQEVDLSNLQVPITTTHRPPFESFRLFKSPDHFEKSVSLGVFTEQHCDQLRKNSWSEIGVHFISPQQDLIANAILTGYAVSNSCPEHTPGYEILRREVEAPPINN